jgi:hypothetical protein
MQETARENIPDIGIPLFEFELIRAAERREQRRYVQQQMLEASRGRGSIHNALANDDSQLKPQRRFSVRSWMALSSEVCTALPTISEETKVETITATCSNSNVKRWADIF